MDQKESPEAPTWETTSQHYLGRWERLVSTTNWEKGRIICQWRQAVIEADARATEYGDEAWSRHVGNVTPQHVGRLRRVYDRFGRTAEAYPGLYWSHFQAALDWNDAEMWLEGALSNGWSVSRMRNIRWEARGARADLKPRDEDIITAELDEDFAAADPEASELFIGSPETVREPADVQGASDDEPARQSLAPTGESTASGVGLDCTPDVIEFEAQTAGRRAAAGVDLEGWPDDLAEAFEQLKLAILWHKMAGWTDVEPEEVLSALVGLEEIVRSSN